MGGHGAGSDSVVWFAAHWRAAFCSTTYAPKNHFEAEAIFISVVRVYVVPASPANVPLTMGVAPAAVPISQ